MTKEEAQKAYNEALSKASDEYRKNTAKAYDDYHKAIAPYQMKWEAELLPHKQRLLRARDEAWEKFNKNTKEV